MGLPAMVTMSFEEKTLCYEGYGPGESAKRLHDAGADIVGINCLRNPENTLPLMKEVRKAVSGFVACQPAAYRTPPGKPDFTSLPEFPYELDPLQLSRKEMATYAAQARDMGINYIGSCCGSVAAHVREMARVLGKKPGAERNWKSKTGKPMSAYEYYEHDKE
jgi:betaine-homocysteine S-methyltransferase